MKCDLFSSTIKSIWILFTLRAAFQPGSVWLFQRIACYMCICLRMCVLLRQTKESLSNIACDSFKSVPQFLCRLTHTNEAATWRRSEASRNFDSLKQWIFRLNAFEYNIIWNHFDNKKTPKTIFYCNYFLQCLLNSVYLPFHFPIWPIILWHLRCLSLGVCFWENSKFRSSTIPLKTFFMKEVIVALLLG